MAFRHYIDVFGLDENSVACINRIFSFASYGPFYNSMLQLMGDAEMLSEYQRIVTEKEWDNYTEKFISEE